jgi:hypothetical protein
MGKMNAEIERHQGIVTNAIGCMRYVHDMMTVTSSCACIAKTSKTQPINVSLDGPVRLLRYEDHSPVNSVLVFI